MNYKVICSICSLSAVLFAAEVRAEERIELCGDLAQGELVVLKNLPQNVDSLLMNEREYPVTEDGIALVAFGRDEALKTDLYTTLDENVSERFALSIAPTKWDIQRINGVQQSKVTPDKSHEAEILREQKDVNRSLTVMQPGNFWREGFIEPVAGRISGRFGNQRVFNGTPKSPHSGTDVAAPEGTPVKAAGSGKVILSGKDYFYTGNMVILDHGYGLQTIYAHLKEAKVTEGDVVKKGDVIGLVGNTGRATGPHLHWGASLNNVRFNPYSLLDINSKKCRLIDGQKEEN